MTLPIRITPKTRDDLLNDVVAEQLGSVTIGLCEGGLPDAAALFQLLQYPNDPQGRQRRIGLNA